MQKTLIKSVKIHGIGLHTGQLANVVLKPSLPNTGIIFIRTDKECGKNAIKADFKNVISAKLCTKIQNSFGVSVSTIEHLMGAIYGEGIDNIEIDVDNSEIPIMDGSALDFVNLIRSAGVKKQDSPRRFVKVLKKVQIDDGKRFISIEPFKKDLKIDFKLVYENELIGNQNEVISVGKDNLETVYSARTFCLYDDIQKMRTLGLIKGGSIDNAVVVKGNKILNKGGLREKNEFVKHKILDCLGDFMLSKYRILGMVKCVHGGHQLTNDLLQKFFSDDSNWKLVNVDEKELKRQKSYNYEPPIAVNA